MAGMLLRLELWLSPSLLKEIYDPSVGVEEAKKAEVTLNGRVHVMFTVGGCRELVSHSNRASSAADTLSGAGRLPRLRQENPDASLWLRGVPGKVMRPASYEFGIQETGVFEQPVVSDPDLRYATDGSPGASQDPRFQALTWGVIAFRVDGSDLVICGKATGPVPRQQTVFRAETQALATQLTRRRPTWMSPWTVKGCRRTSTKLAHCGRLRTSLVGLDPTRTGLTSIGSTHTDFSSFVKKFVAADMWSWKANRG